MTEAETNFLCDMYERLYPALVLTVWEFQLHHGHPPSGREFREYINSSPQFINEFERWKHIHEQN